MNICKGNGGEYPTKGLVLMLVPASPEQKGNGSPTFTGKKVETQRGKSLLELPYPGVREHPAHFSTLHTQFKGQGQPEVPNRT